MTQSTRRAALQHTLEAACLAVIDSHPKATVIKQGDWHTLIEYGRWIKRRKLLTVHIDGSITIHEIPWWWPW